jgi:hypothetical protein
VARVGLGFGFAVVVEGLASAGGVRRRTSPRSSRSRAGIRSCGKRKWSVVSAVRARVADWGGRVRSGFVVGGVVVVW